MGKYRIKINSTANLETLLQETYDLAQGHLNLTLKEMNKLSESVDLKDELIDGKGKYAKAMHDYISDRDKALSRLIDIAKMLNEVIKYNGDVNSALKSKELNDSVENDYDFNTVRNAYNGDSDNNEDRKKIDYELK